MARKPADSAYLLALALRTVWENQQETNRHYHEANKIIRKMNVEGAKFGLPPRNEFPEDDCVLWASVIRVLEGMKDVSEGLSMVTDNDYRAIIWDAIKQPYNKVRKSKGFTNLVPALETIRRYGPYDDRQPMHITEEEARDLADLIWQQEMAPFIEEGRGVDPINKQIIANKVSFELKQVNVKYIGEEVVSVEFNDVELDLYEYDHRDALDILFKGLQCAYELFNYDPAATKSENTRDVRQCVLMYDSMLQKDRNDEQLTDLVDSIIRFFEYTQRLIE